MFVQHVCPSIAHSVSFLCPKSSFSFKNIMFETLAGQYIDRAFRKMVTAFEARAEELYGKSNSSAQSVA